MKNLLCRTALFSLALGLASPTAFAQVGPGPFSAFPTEDPADGRFMGFGCAGLATFEQDVELSLAAAAGTVDFDINIFDGDTGGLDGAGRRHWDLGVRQLVFSLYADPTRTGSTDPADRIGQWFGNSANATSGPLWTSTAALMPDNAWWGLTVATSANAQAPSGNYFYNLVVGTDGSCSAGEQLESSLKIAASNPMTFRTPRFGLVGGLRQTVNDVPIIYPGSTPTMPVTGSFLTAPTTFDGTFSFFFTLPGGETELRLYDGDFDYGTGAVAGNPSDVPLDPCADVDDPDTDAAYTGFPFVTTGANPEGMQGPGIPPDDNFRDIFRRGELGDPNRVGCVRYEVTDPEGNVYFNDNPSGSFEWEQFLIASSDSAEAGNADWVYPGATLPGGTWRVTIVGLDLANLNFWFADTCASRPAHPPMPGEDPGSIPRVSACPDQASYLLGDTVWADTNGNGVLDSGEAGIPGVTMELVRPSDGAVIATTVTGDMTGPNAAACLANNTGNDALGLYCFGMDAPGTSTVRVATSNFAPGGPLAGLSSTTGGESQTFPLTTTNVLTYDFGYAAAVPDGSLGDRVWLDFDADGAQDAGEAGLNGVTVELLGSGGSVLATRATSGDGTYTFSNLAAGGYSVRVVSATLPAGLAPSYDLDGIGTAHVAAAALAAGENRTDVDFGYRGTGSLGDRVWLDFDADGVQDAGETGLNFVMVELLGSGGSVVASQATSGDGNYTFSNLAAGAYSVRVVSATLPAGLAPSYDLDGIGTAHVAAAALGAGENRTDFDFGYRGTGSLGDRVWLDFDADGAQDAGEAGLNGVTVELLGSGGSVLASQATSGDGDYTFSNLAAGSYSVRVVSATLPAGLAPSYDLDGIGTAHVAAAALGAGENRTDVDFGYRGTGSLGDRVWLDFDADGVQDAGEAGLNGVTVELLGSGGSVVASQATSGDGNYTFSNLAAGGYSVRVVSATLPAGLAPSYDLDGIGTAHVAAAALGAGENRTDIDFGYRGTGSLGDRVWLDFDADGVQEVGEAGLNGVTVELLGSGGSVVASQATSGDGNYTFSNLAAGGYSVRVVSATLPAGLAPSYDLDGIGTAHVAAAALAAGENRTDVDFGYRGTGSLGDRVWLDFDADGVQDAGEAGLNFVMVELLDGAKNVLTATSTSGDGRYTFQNLPLATYRVRVAASTLPPGTVPTYDLDGLGSPHLAVAALVEKVPTRTDVDFGYRGTASLGDRVWFDGDGDAIEDAGEPGIGGVTVHLVNPVSKGILATAITGSGGEYVFANLSAGIYQVRVEVATLPAGLAPTFDLDGVGTPHLATAALAAGESRTDVDFGYRGVGQMGDRVWLDGDGDGVQDLLEPGIAGVTVLLLDGDGRRLARQTTGPDGQYLFVNLVAGNYRIQVDPASMPAGLEPTYDLDGISTPHVAVCPLVSKESRFDVDFGYRGAGALGDRVWLDGNGDGIQDPGELGLAGIDVILTDAAGDVVAVATTGADGIYLFSALLAGTYTATVDSATVPAGYLQTFDFDGLATPHRATVPLGAGEVQLAVDFGYREPAVNPRCVEEAISDPAVQSTGTVHAIWMPGIGPDYQFTPSPGTFTEDVAAGTATIAGVVRSLTNRDNAWQVLLSFSGRTSTPPPGSPKKELRPAYYSENGGPIDAATWYYYPTLSGIFQGIGNNLGARVRVTRVGPAFQVGQGANGKNLNFGGSGWFAWTVEVQPTSGSSLPATGQGDVNVDILACPSDVAGPPGVVTTGYWRTHPSAWPTLAFKLGDRLYTRDDAVALLGTEARGDWTVEIAKRLIAARLNVTAGNEASCILETIDRANAWLQAYRIGSGIRSTSTAWKAGEPLAARLDAYNRGRLCAPPRE